MAGSLNKVLLIGNVGRDPEMRYTPGGDAVTSFSLATNRRWNGADGQPHEETEWHNIVAWRKLAEQCNEYLTKGRKIYIEGHLQTRSWDDKETGQKKYRTEVIANTMLMLDQRDQRPRDDEDGFGAPSGAQSMVGAAAGGGARPAGARNGNGRSSGGSGGFNGGPSNDENAIDLEDTPF